MDNGVVTGTMVVDSLSARVGGAGKSVCRRKECFDVWIRCVVSGYSGRCRNVSPSCNGGNLKGAKPGIGGGGHDSNLKQAPTLVRVSI
ncbi:hypothetical protein BT69DRAFT_1291389 [Atractiella rhizophila]|nr:hypothetical protein BT69DRAFT_1291389 [Atractiella rhizophila]